MSRYSNVAVAKKLRGRQPRLTMRDASDDRGTRAMLFRKKNRRRIDVAKKTGEFTAAAKQHAPVVLKVLGAMVATGATAFGALWVSEWATTSPIFALADVQVVGASRSTDAALVKLGGLTPGLNLFLLDTSASERAIAAHPWVKQVDVRRRFPAKVTVTVTEHTAVAMLSLGDLYLVNADGQPFKRVQASEPIDVPLLTGIERDDFVAERGDSLESVRSMLAVLDTYQRSPAAKGHPVSEVRRDGDNTVLVTDSGETVALGQGDVEAKLERLVRVRRELTSRKLTAAVVRLDNRARPNWVTVTPMDSHLAASPEKGKRP